MGLARKTTENSVSDEYFAPLVKSLSITERQIWLPNSDPLKLAVSTSDVPLWKLSIEVYIFLQAHSRRHSGEKPFRCTWQNCAWRFSRSDELARHKRSHSGQKPYYCYICGKCFARSDHLGKHVKVCSLLYRISSNKHREVLSSVFFYSRALGRIPIRQMFFTLFLFETGSWKEEETAQPKMLKTWFFTDFVSHVIYIILNKRASLC